MPSMITPAMSGRGSSRDRIRPWMGRRLFLSVNAPSIVPSTVNLLSIVWMTGVEGHPFRIISAMGCTEKMIRKMGQTVDAR